MSWASSTSASTPSSPPSTPPQSAAPSDTRSTRRPSPWSCCRTSWNLPRASCRPASRATIPDFLGLAFDPELALSLIANSRYAGSPLLDNIRLTISGAGATPGIVIEAIQEMWRANLGIEVQIQQVETASFFQELDRGLYQLFNVGWILDYPDAENILDLKFHGSSLQKRRLLFQPGG